MEDINPYYRPHISRKGNQEKETSAQLLCGRKATFGDREQIEYLKQVARLTAAEEAGQVDIQVSSILPQGERKVKDHVVVVNFKCPGCLSSHHFSYTVAEVVSSYSAPCGTHFSYNAVDERLQVAPFPLH